MSNYRGTGRLRQNATCKAATLSTSPVSPACLIADRRGKSGVVLQAKEVVVAAATLRPQCGAAPLAVRNALHGMGQKRAFLAFVMN